MVRSVACLFLSLSVSSAFGQTPDELAAGARKILETNCYVCHGKDDSAEGGFDYVLDVKKLAERGKVVPGNAAKSKLFERVKSGCMPPKEEKQRPSADDIATLERWIAGGAIESKEEPPKRKVNKTLSEQQVYSAIYDHLKDNPDDAKYRRFITLVHLYNDPSVGEAELRYYRAGVVKLLNSLSWKRATVKAEPVDRDGAVLMIDLRDLDWDKNDGWSLIVGKSGTEGKPGFHPGYPYGLKHDEASEKKFATLASDVYRLTGTSVPAVRADWFIATASTPPLYHELLNLPDTLEPLEKQLKVDRAANFRRDRLARAAFTKSGVSAQANRLVERHEAAYGAYWLSYDFRSSEGTGSLTRFPLGPLNLAPKGKHPYADQAFVHDGGEAIWNLPNGLQAYLLVTGDGKRIDDGPPDVVRDKNELGGKSTLVVNGLSCMGCHQHGMIRDSVKDIVRTGFGGERSLIEKVQRLYPETKEMNRLMQLDEDLFVSSLERMIGPILKVGRDKDKDFKLFPEPVTLLASPFLKGSVDLKTAAFDLGIPPEELKIAIKNNPKIRDDLGLKVLAAGDSIKRTEWHSVKGLTSPFQETAQELGLGQPIIQRFIRR